MRKTRKTNFTKSKNAQSKEKELFLWKKKFRELARAAGRVIEKEEADVEKNQKQTSPFGH